MIPLTDELVSQLMQTSAGERTPVGQWSIFWTGWKNSIDSIDVMGQWVALPIISESNVKDPSRHVLYVSLPGSLGAIVPGEMIDVSYRVHMPLATYGQMIAEDPQSLHRSMRIGLESLFDLMHASDWAKDQKAPWKKPSLLEPKIWCLLSDRTKWWHSPNQWCAEHPDIVGEGVSDAGTLPDDLMYRLIRHFSEGKPL